MATIEIQDRSFVVHIEGYDKVLTMTGSITVPFGHVRAVQARPDLRDLLYMEMGSRFRGVQSPGKSIVGLLRSPQGAHDVSCDVRDEGRAIAIELDHDVYERIVVDISDESPDEAVRRIEQAIHPAAGAHPPRAV